MISISDQLDQKKIQLELKKDEIEMTRQLNKEELKGDQINLKLENDLLKKYEYLMKMVHILKFNISNN